MNGAFVKLKDRVINPAHLVTLWKDKEQNTIRVDTVTCSFYIYYSSVDEMETDFENACKAIT